MKYRKRPVIVEAHQWFKNGDHPADNCDIIGPPPEAEPNANDFCLTEGKVVRYFRDPDTRGAEPCKHCGKWMHDHGWIDTLEGGHIVCPGDYIITGVAGEYYPCKPDIFQATYEMCAENASDRDYSAEDEVKALQLELADEQGAYNALKEMFDAVIDCGDCQSVAKIKARAEAAEARVKVLEDALDKIQCPACGRITIDFSRTDPCKVCNGQGPQIRASLEAKATPK